MGDESAEVVKRKILFRAVHRAVRDHSPLVLCRASYSNFQILDLDTGKFTKTPYTLLGDAGIGTLVSLGSVIYTLGKPKLVFSRPDYSEYYSHIKTQDDIVTVHEGLSYFDYSAYPNPNPDWNKGPLVSEDQYYPLCVAHSGKLYAFTTRSDTSTTCLGEVYDPQANIWDPLPKPAPLLTNKYKVLPPVVSDPMHGRILVDVQFSLPFLNSIYAYYPADERWDCLVGKFDGNWMGPLALVDGVIYSYARKCNPILQAYDLHSKQWLEVVLTEQFDTASMLCIISAMVSCASLLILIKSAILILLYLKTTLSFFPFNSKSSVQSVGVRCLSLHYLHYCLLWIPSAKFMVKLPSR